MIREIIEAGAGCGKTYGLVTRYLAALGLNRGSPQTYRNILPGKILTLTFTNDAAEEMRARISSALLEAGREDLAKQVEEQGRISTFHSFCYKILKPHLPGLGYADSEVLSVIESQAHKMSHVLATLAASPLSEQVQKLIDLNRLYSFCSANWRRPRREIETEIQTVYEQVAAATSEWIDATLELFRAVMAANRAMFENPELWPYRSFEALSDRNWAELAAVTLNGKGVKKNWSTDHPELYARVQTLRDFAKNNLDQYLNPEFYQTEINAFAQLFDFLEELQATAPKLLDFDALEVETQNFLRATPQEAPSYELIIVDEFQDTNKRQVEIIELLTGAATELYFVGDPKQSIYSFRGGDVRVFEAQKEILEVSSLDTNRRSLPSVLSFMNELTQGIFNQAGDPSPQVLKPCDEKIAAAAAISSKIVITSVLDKKHPQFWDTLARDLRAGGAPATQAILCQQWSRAFEAFEELQRRGIAVELGNDLDLSQHHLSALWIAFLKTQSPLASEDAIAHWNHLSREWNLTPLDEALTASAQDPRAWLRHFVNAVLPHRWPEGGVWLATMESWIQNHCAQLRWIATAVELASSFQKSMNMRLTLDSPTRHLGSPAGGEKNPSVVITTIHKAKGLQYQNVFLLDLFDGTRRGAHQSVTDADEEESLESLPLKTSSGQILRPLYFRHKKFVSDQKILAEKKRLFYVAYTRAEENLYFYLSDQIKEPKLTASVETEIWKWPRVQGTSWEAAVQAAANATSDHLPIERRRVELDQSPLPATEVVDAWTLPAPRPLAETGAAAPFMRAGTRTYIDEVLYPEAKVFNDTAAVMPSPTKANQEIPLDPNGALALGSALHEILEVWNGREGEIEAQVTTRPTVQQPKLRSALEALARYPDLAELWQDAEQHPERVQRELGLFVFGEHYRLSGFADLVWFKDADTAIVLDWKSSSTAWAATAALKVAKTEAQVALYGSALAPLFKNIEIWSLAVIFEPTAQLKWLFKKSLPSSWRETQCGTPIKLY